VNASRGISLLAPAKLNISLKVFGRRPDGYHHIRSVMVPVSLYDVVTVEEAPSGVEVLSDDPLVPTGEDNTCHRAALAFMRRKGAPAGVRIRLAKRIPSGAGLGGGSSDAAATLKGLSVLTGNNLSREETLEMAAGIGADVPFFALGLPALAEGKGEVLSPVEWGVPFFALIVMPPFGLSTAEAYGRLGRGAGEPPEMKEAPVFREWGRVVSEVGNDFEEAWSSVRPEIGKTKGDLMAAGAAAAGLTGSGAAVFGLFETEVAARKGLGALPHDDGRKCFIARNI
jgi:4-diphosphocytidyl-2-C-methyl-D-erythritol kinase